MRVGAQDTDNSAVTDDGNTVEHHLMSRDTKPSRYPLVKADIYAYQ